ncbi:MAG: nuclear transport factor 2 family protein [Acidimicrobiales bacterium]
MTLSPFELVKSHYDANTRRDLPGMLAPLAADVAWTEMEGFPLGGTYVGPDAIRRGVFERLGREWRDYSATLDSLYDAGDTIIATGWYAGMYPPTGKAMRCRFAHVWRVADGLVVAFEQFTDTQLVAAAMTPSASAAS